MTCMASVILAALIVVGSAFTGTQEEGAVTGLWLSESRSQGGLGSWFEFRADGKVQAGFGAVVEFTYRMEGASLVLTPKGDTSALPAVTLRIDGDTAVRQQPTPPDAPKRETLSPDERAMLDRLSQPLTLTRIGQAAPGAPLIVGTWTYTHPTGATAYERFTPGGEMVLLVEMQAGEGTYTVHADSVDVVLPTSRQTLTRKGETLVMRGTEGQAMAYRRAPR